MAKRMFSYKTEWSDQSEYSPQTTGQLPDFLTLQDGTQVDLQPDDRAPFMRSTRDGYVQIHEGVKVRYTFWGDDGTRRMGRAGGKVEIICPKGSRFFFRTRCPLCGEPRGYVSEDALDALGRTRPRWHQDCWREFSLSQPAPA